jgi:threonine synthase
VKDNDNLTIERPTFVTHLECAMEGDHYPADQVHNLSKAGKPLLVRYDLAGVKKALTKDALARRPTCGATASCCRCGRRPISSASARSRRR